MPKAYPTPSNKIYSWTDFKKQKVDPRRSRILVGGCFDLLHYGHVRFLEEARALEDILIVAIESDEFIIKSKKRKPIHTQAERAHNLAALMAVDYIITLPYLTTDQKYRQLVVDIHPSTIAVTVGDPQIQNKKAHGKLIGASVVSLPHYKKFASSHISRNASIYRD